MFVRRPLALALALVLPCCSAFGSEESEGGGGGAPTAIASGRSVKGLAASGDRVAFVDNKALWLGVGAKDPYFATDAPAEPVPGHVIIHGTQAFFATGSFVTGCEITGAPCKGAGIGPGINFIGVIAARDQEVLFVNANSSGDTLFSCILPYCANPVTIALLGGNARRMVATKSSVILGLAVSQSNASIVRYVGTQPSVLANNVLALTGLATDSQYVYWTDAGPGVVRRCDVNDCAGGPKDLASGRAEPSEVTVDSDRLYWLETKGDVMRCSLPACTDAASMAKVQGARFLAVGDRVYVASESTLYAMDK